MNIFTANRIGRLVYFGWMLPICLICVDLPPEKIIEVRQNENGYPNHSRSLA
jgi:hypothetical protein